MSAHSDDILDRWSSGIPTLADGKTPLVPVQDIIARQKWQANVDKQLAALAAPPVSQVVLSDTDRAKIVADLAAHIPTAAQIAQELATRLGNG